MRHTVHKGIGLERRSTGPAPAWRVQTSPKCVQNLSYCVHTCLVSVQKYSGDFGKSWTRHDGHLMVRTKTDKPGRSLDNVIRTGQDAFWHELRLVVQVVSWTDRTQFGQLAMDTTGHCLDRIWAHLDMTGHMPLRSFFGQISDKWSRGRKMTQIG